MIDPQPAGSDPHSDAERAMRFFREVARMEHPTERPPVDEATTRAALDTAIHAHAADKLDEDELIVNWIVVVGTRKATGGGYVITLAHDHMPKWEAEGILSRALTVIDADEED